MDGTVWHKAEESSWLHHLPQPSPNQRKHPYILGIMGPSGLGKSTLAQRLAEHLTHRGETTLVLGMDDFFVSPQLRAQKGEWGPDHVRLEDLARILRGIKAGKKSFHTQRYVREPQKQLVPWTLNLQDVSLVIFEGLYALSRDPDCGGFGDFVDFGLFLTASSQLQKRWRFQQEREKAVGRDKQNMERHWRLGILPDTANYIMPAMVYANLVLELNQHHQFKVNFPPFTESAQPSG